MRMMRQGMYRTTIAQSSQNARLHLDERPRCTSTDADRRACDQAGCHHQHFPAGGWNDFHGFRRPTRTNNQCIRCHSACLDAGDFIRNVRRWLRDCWQLSHSEEHRRSKICATGPESSARNAHRRFIGKDQQCVSIEAPGSVSFVRVPCDGETIGFRHALSRSIKRDGAME